MFGKLFGSKASEKSAPSARSLSSAVSAAILSVVGGKSIPYMPGAAQKAFTLSTDPNAEARDFIEVIESDEALSARVLKIANSVYFDRGKPSQTIEDSVLVIGINELRCLLNATSLSDIFPSKLPARTALWGHDIATALIARDLAEKVLPSKSELAFLAGLMHDVGKLLLLQRTGNNYEQVIHRVEDEGVDFTVAENEVFPFDHTEVGQLIGERWNFGPDLQSAIRDHHSTWEYLQQRDDTLGMIVKAADIFAHALGLGDSKQMHKFKSRQLENTPAAFDALGIPAGDRKDSLARYQRTFETECDLYIGKSAQ